MPALSENVEECPLCGSTRSRIFDRQTLRGLGVINRLCSICGLVYQSPRMSAAELDRFYQDEYRRLYQGTAGPSRKDLLVQHGRAETLLHFAEGQIPPPGRCLDIGCSSGALLERLEARFGCQVVGVEPDPAYRAYARNRGLTVYPSLGALLADEDGRFDLISLAHVLEHLPHPVAYLAHLRRTLLAPDGWLLLEVPNLYAHDCFEVAHLVSFSPHTLAQTVQKAGFEPISVQRHGQPRSVVLPLYITCLARPAPKPAPRRVRPERWVGARRRLGMLQRRVLQRLFPDLAWLPMPLEPQPGQSERLPAQAEQR